MNFKQKIIKVCMIAFLFKHLTGIFPANNTVLCIKFIQLTQNILMQYETQNKEILQHIGHNIFA